MTPDRNIYNCLKEHAEYKLLHRELKRPHVDEKIVVFPSSLCEKVAGCVLQCFPEMFVWREGLTIDWDTINAI